MEGNLSDQTFQVLWKLIDAQKIIQIGSEFGIISQLVKNKGVYQIQLQKFIKQDLFYNRITDLIFGSRQIQHLNLENNKLYKIHFLNNLKDLKYLNLGNLIDKIDFLVFNIQLRTCCYQVGRIEYQKKQQNINIKRFIQQCQKFKDFGCKYQSNL
ncbi:unnamed protein product [Paramecium sonneborni]|uniref:Uncharacterized protein n=1 Tax=Paramecium sonneborni TaxID=65129 RepID=A0A8S1NYZ9_9CILI|nr:unnamed protein product [Paramecium sonneborni]